MKIDCAAYAKNILDGVKEKISKIPVDERKGLLILSAGDDPASDAYMRGKKKDCEYCGIPYWHEVAKTKEDLLTWISYGNTCSRIGGIIIQLPLPELLGDSEQYTSKVTPQKDVDGFVSGSKFKPCTPEAIMYLLRDKLENLEGTDILLIGKGKLVGRPLIPMLLDAGVTLTVCGSKTEGIRERYIDGEIFYDAIITAVGKELFDPDHAYTQLIIDAGMHRGEDGKLHGDCDTSDIQTEFGREIAYTPCPGGVGLLTRAFLMFHMWRVQT